MQARNEARLDSARKQNSDLEQESESNEESFAKKIDALQQELE